MHLLPPGKAKKPKTTFTITIRRNSDSMNWSPYHHALLNDSLGHGCTGGRGHGRGATCFEDKIRVITPPIVWTQNIKRQILFDSGDPREARGFCNVPKFFCEPLMSDRISATSATLAFGRCSQVRIE
jgi:hypothetical protein